MILMRTLGEGVGIKKLIKDLEAARGKGTSMISLIMPPHDQIARVTKMLVMSLELLQT